MAGRQPLKVVYAVGFYRNFTGSQRSLAELVANLPPTVDAVVVVSRTGRAADELRARGLRVRILGTPEPLTAGDGELLRAGPFRRAALALRFGVPLLVRSLRLLRDERPDLVHCNDARALVELGLAARLLRIPVVWHLRGGNVFARSRPLRSLSTWISTATVVVAEAVRPLAPRRHPVFVTYDAVPAAPDGRARPAPPVRALLAERGLPAGAVVVLTASSFVPYKGLHHVVPALASVAQADGLPPVAWVVLGHATTPGQQRYRDHLESLARSAGIGDRIVWAGWQGDAVAWMEASDIVVLPTVERERFAFDGEDGVVVTCDEGLPRTLLEAMVAGRPAVASDVAGVREQIDDGRTGVVVPAGDSAALAAAIARLVGDPALRASMGEGARSRAAFFSADRFVEGTLDAYDRVLAR
jgi:glycosyltransferase involved in cell wall biosynthesis